MERHNTAGISTAEKYPCEDQGPKEGEELQFEMRNGRLGKQVPFPSRLYQTISCSTRVLLDLAAFQNLLVVLIDFNIIIGIRPARLHNCQAQATCLKGWARKLNNFAVTSTVHTSVFLRT